MLRALKPLGYESSVQRWAQDFSGKLSEDIMGILAREHGVVFPADFYEQTQADMHASFDRELQAIPGMAELIRGLPQVRAVVSNSDLAHVHRCLALAGLTDVFGKHTYSAEQVAHPKPAPDVYRLALQQLTLPPESVWVVEDSTTGVQAATAAGLQVIGFLGASHVGEGHGENLLAAGASLIAADAAELKALIERGFHE
jgi:HAD superfamily hydrolase (TIGR01509 family)